MAAAGTRRERGEEDPRAVLTAVVRLRFTIFGSTTLSRLALRLRAKGRFTARLRTVAAFTETGVGSPAFRFATVRFRTAGGLGEGVFREVPAALGAATEPLLSSTADSFDARAATLIDRGGGFSFATGLIGLASGAGESEAAAAA